LTQTTDVENYPGFENAIDGTVLVETMRKQAERLGVRIMMDEVSSCELSGDVKKIKTEMNGELETRAVIVATGASARYLGLESEQRFMGKGISACATCDGAFFKGQRVAVVGGGDTAMEDALYLSRMAERVTVIHRRDQFRASKIMADRVLGQDKIDVVWDSVVEEIVGDKAGAVAGLRLKNVKSGAVSELEVPGVFIAIGHVPNTAFLSGQLELDAEGYIVTDRTRTSAPGVFAAGDVQDRAYKQAVTAAGSGCMAALEAERYIDSV